jgi:hypothetical protein
MTIILISGEGEVFRKTVLWHGNCILGLGGKTADKLLDLGDLRG